MKNIIELKEIVKNKKSITYNYDLHGEWTRFFKTEKDFTISYPLDVDKVPESVLVVPFVSNFLPIVWLCDAEMKLLEIDADFYEQLDNLKSGYKNMYPMLDFNGKVVANSVVKNKIENQDKSAVFFSGGVDAYTTLFRHIEENPYLITIWGADIKTNNESGWKNVENHIHEVAEEFQLQYYVIKSEFRQVIQEGVLCQIVRDSGDGWWHGFQHGMAIISHIAPLAYLLGVKTDYIASTFPEYMKGEYTCASDPTIDNYMSFCGCNTVHDGYKLDRDEKVRYIVQEKEKGYPVKLRVCWQSDGGKNCCRCEKCYRTILEIVAEGSDPNEYGFEWGKEDIKICEKDLKTKCVLHQKHVDQYYLVIQKNMKLNKNKIRNYESYAGILNMDFSDFNNYPMKKFRRSLVGRVLSKLRILK